MWYCSIFLVCVVAVGCIPSSEFGASHPTTCVSNVDKSRTYRSSTGTRLGVNWEINSHEARAPIIVYVHGGAWIRNSKEYNYFYQRSDILQNELSSRGINVVSIDYNLFVPESFTHPFPTQRNDLIEFLKSIDTPDNRICLVAHSAGAHIASTAAHLQAAEGFTVDCIIAYSGIFDLDEYGAERIDRASYSDYSSVNWIVRTSNQFSDSATENGISPVHTVPDNYSTPTLLIHDVNDTVVRIEQSRGYFDALDAVQAPVTFLEIENADKPHRPKLFGGCGDQEDSEEAAMLRLFLSIYLD